MNSREKEEWRDIEGFEGRYQVSNLGRVKSLAKYNRKTDILLHPTKHKRDGRMSVMLCKDVKTRKRIMVHRLVAKAFVENPKKYTEVNHKDENPENNRATNLEWCDRKYNMNYGTLPQRINEKNKKPVIGWNSEVKVRLSYIREAKKKGYTTQGICESLKTGKKYKGLYWRYDNGN